MLSRWPRASSAIPTRRAPTKAISALATVVSLLSPASALQFTPNSACASLCTDSPALDASDPNVSNTSGSDVVCRDGDYSNSPPGYCFETCLDCLQSSAASSSDENDQAWCFYNLRFALNSCIFGSTNATDPLSTPCSTSTACGPLASALGDGMGTPLTTSPYSYCTAYENTFSGSSLGSDVPPPPARAIDSLAVLVALQAGCAQRPASGIVTGLNSTVFTKNEVVITSPQNPVSTKKDRGLSTETLIGMAVGCGVVLLLLVAAAFVCARKRRTARRLRQLQSPLHERFGADNITAPHSGAYSSPQTSPPFKSEGLPTSPAPKVGSLGFSRERAQYAGGWQGTSIRDAPLETYPPSPPLYSPPCSDVDPMPAHPAYLPPDYAPPSRNSTSPLSSPPPASSRDVRSVSSASRLPTQNLSARRGFVPTPVQRGGEGGGSRRARKPGRRSRGRGPQSDISVELWPGSYRAGAGRSAVYDLRGEELRHRYSWLLASRGWGATGWRWCW
ncbi:LPXTG-domain-containing protein [Diplocarpon mali]|nr:LPXTG-domain-containing protein [Diplocarpon mali]